MYLPPSYRRQPTRRYPVRYRLHGATSTPEEWLNGVYHWQDFVVRDLVGHIDGHYRTETNAR